ncbi:MAG: efflux RND transporter periplasmic adaptor subunit [Verrucomicrobiota bacterium]
MKRFLPILILGVAAAIVAALIILKPEPEATLPEQSTASIEVLIAQPETVQLSVSSQGTVLPRIESDLAVEVSGRIIEMAPSFRPGGRFKADDVLFRIDPADYEAARATRAAELANAELGLAQEEALAEQAEADWAALGEGEPSDLTLRKPQLTQARALVASAEAALKKAERDLERTEIKAPYNGLVLTKNVDLGQYVTVNPASPAARVYSTESAEVRLPLAQREVFFLDDPEKIQSPVRLFSGDQEWAGRFTRFEATIDPTSRLIYAVVEIENPFEKGLRRGLFVEAEITGRSIDKAYVLPRYALRGSNTVYVVTDDQTLVTREVEILKTDRRQAVLSGGLEPGEQVTTSPIAYFVEGMPVEIISTP